MVIVSPVMAKVVTTLTVPVSALIHGLGSVPNEAQVVGVASFATSRALIQFVALDVSPTLTASPASAFV